MNSSYVGDCVRQRDNYSETANGAGLAFRPRISGRVERLDRLGLE
jgi:hypothetical protein